MADLTTPPPNPQNSQEKIPVTSPEPTVFRCLSGSTIAGGFAYAFYLVTVSIAQSFANKPIHSDNITVINISAAVRTLVVGIVALGTGIFGLAALGLFALAIQLFIQRLMKRSDTPSGV